MVRTYKRKTQDKYSKDDLEQALSNIRNKKMFIKYTAAHYHIPTRIIFHRLAGSRTGAGRCRKNILTNEDESYLVTTIILFQKWQCSISSSAVIGLAKPYMIQLGKPVALKSTLRDWSQGLMQLWSKEIKLAKTVKLEKVGSEACRKETVAKCYFFLPFWQGPTTGHYSGDFAKAGIYPYEPRGASNEKLLGPSSSNDESASVDDSAVIHKPVNRLTRSTSCEQLSAMALSITTTSLLNISDQSISIANGLYTITTTPVISPIDHIRMPSTILPMTTDSSRVDHFF
ncbi:unnamed protein product [Rotaria magnacalcarata]|uniref:HTH psq-type domain-containing protein n=1 Tax=Rotaria magnacalcarata TaxID=392030 RepID=A0A816MF00_9BILA|nr:unnamed protein product [Rotaria magnacalcarata]